MTFSVLLSNPRDCCVAFALQTSCLTLLVRELRRFLEDLLQKSQPVVPSEPVGGRLIWR